MDGSQSTITMTGGTISSNTASENGGGFNNNDGTIFKLENGSVTKNSGKSGAGVTNWRATFSMTGGSITLNTGTYCGAGVDTNGEVGFPGIFNLSGGLIQNNTTSASNGGGICKGSNGVLNKTGGTVSSNAPNDIFLAP